MASSRHRRRGPVLGAIDLGTNNCRLLIARPKQDGTLEVVGSFSRIVRLGEGVSQSGVLSEAAIERTLAALKICAQKLRQARATHVRAIATEAARRATNADTLVQRALSETGLTLQVVSSEEEARLAAVGCAPLIGEQYEGAIVFDIGGGSTEIIRMRRGPEGLQMVASLSIPLGVVNVEEEIRNTQTGYARLRDTMIARFEPARRALDPHADFAVERYHLLGTSGTVTTLAGVRLGLSRYAREKVDGTWHLNSDILNVVDRLMALDTQGRRAVGCVGAERADLIVPGCAIFAAIYALWPTRELRVADRGLREGMLRELAGEVRR